MMQPNLILPRRVKEQISVVGEQTCTRLLLRDNDLPEEHFSMCGVSIYVRQKVSGHAKYKRPKAFGKGCTK